MNKISVIAQFRKSRPDSTSGMIIIRGFFNRKPVASISTNIKIKDIEWDQANRCVFDWAANAQLANIILDSKLQIIHAELMKKEISNCYIDAAVVARVIKGHDDSDFISYAISVIETKKLRDENGYSEETKRRYHDEVNRIQRFRKNILFKDITPQFLQQYKSWLQKVYIKKDGSKLHKNSIWKAFAFLRMVWNEAERNDTIKGNNPFKIFEVGSCETDFQKIKYLELSQVDAIEKLLIEKAGQLEDITIRIGWRFLCMCVLGMRISDAMNLNDASVNDAGSIQFIPFKTRHHGNIAQIPIISERQRRYLQKSFEHPIANKNAKTFRTIFNQHLKIIEQLAEISVHITSHVGRHTMGSFLVDGGVEEKAAMAMLGVKSSAVIKTYMHLKQSKLIEEASKLKNIF